jgi:site-specific DNA-methyltransferase (adenine-specific)
VKPYYDDGTVTIYHGRCEDVLPTLPCADLIFTSPPYNLARGSSFTSGRKNGAWRTVDETGGIAYDGHDDSMPTPEYEEWQRDVLRACWARLSESGAIFYNHKPRILGRELWTPLALNPGLPVRQIVIWDRGGGFNWVPTAFLPAHEWIVIYARDGWRLRTRGASAVGDVWRVPPDHGNPHPAPFPAALPARAIAATAPTLVLDPFAGSGSTLRAAKDHGCRAIGIEKSERYCEIAAQRCAQDVLGFAA